MNKRLFSRRIAVTALVATMWILPNVAIAQQTRITAPKNKYKVQDDIKLGNQAVVEVEKQFPLINDQDATAYIERVGRRLAGSIPPEFRHNEFNYRFKWVNASDINAFALPGGPMYINRGMIESAKNEGEMAGVMAHELSHVALRHATAQATKQSSGGSIAKNIGLILGGAILGGQAGAQLGAGIAGVLNLKYSREYESQADMLGARIMADAGYDPHDLANVFKTIQESEKGGGGTPAWLSDHPDLGKRYDAINREANYLRVSQNPIKITRDFERVQARFRALPKAKTMSQIEKEAQTGQNTENPTSNPTSGGRYADRVAYPSTRLRAYSGISWLSINVPSNWQDFPGQNEAQFAPDGAFGAQGITRGMLVGTFSPQNSNDLLGASNEYLNGVLQGNSYLRKRGNFAKTYVAGRQGYATSASGQSPVTGKNELVSVYTTQLNNGQLFYAVTVVPEDESFSYRTSFKNVLSSIRLND